MAVNESAENYLETILVLSKTHPVVRSVDIAEELGFKKSSVSVAMKNLREKNHITVTKEGFIYLTDTGRQIAEMIYERHELISGWLIQLGVDPETAVSDACRMEHVISPESFAAIKKHVLENRDKQYSFPKVHILLFEAANIHRKRHSRRVMSFFIPDNRMCTRRIGR